MFVLPKEFFCILALVALCVVKKQEVNYQAGSSLIPPHHQTECMKEKESMLESKIISPIILPPPGKMHEEGSSDAIQV